MWKEALAALRVPLSSAVWRVSVNVLIAAGTKVDSARTLVAGRYIGPDRGQFGPDCARDEITRVEKSRENDIGVFAIELREVNMIKEVDRS